MSCAGFLANFNEPAAYTNKGVNKPRDPDVTASAAADNC